MKKVTTENLTKFKWVIELLKHVAKQTEKTNLKKNPLHLSRPGLGLAMAVLIIFHFVLKSRTIESYICAIKNYYSGPNFGKLEEQLCTLYSFNILPGFRKNITFNLNNSETLINFFTNSPRQTRFGRQCSEDVRGKASHSKRMDWALCVKILLFKIKKSIAPNFWQYVKLFSHVQMAHYVALLGIV